MSWRGCPTFGVQFKNSDGPFFTDDGLEIEFQRGIEGTPRFVIGFGLIVAVLKQLFVEQIAYSGTDTERFFPMVTRIQAENAVTAQTVGADTVPKHLHITFRPARRHLSAVEAVIGGHFPILGRFVT